MAVEIKHILLDELSKIPDNKVAVLLSGGVDSVSSFLALMELGKEPVGYTFTLEDRESTDFKVARNVCETFQKEFVPIYLPTDLEVIKKDLLYVIRDQGMRKKADIECMWAFNYGIRAVKERFITSGNGADRHFGMGKSAKLRGHLATVEKFDAFRIKYWQAYIQGDAMRKEAQKQGKEVIFPYATQIMIDTFLGHSWEELNKPKQKMPIRALYPEQYDQIKVRNHQNLQLGDSGIAEQFERLLQSDWNTRDQKAVIGIYNDIANNKVGIDINIDLPLFRKYVKKC